MSKKIIIKVITLVFLLSIISSFTACSYLIDSLLEEYYPEEELLVTSGRNCADYIYSDKVHIRLLYNEKDHDDSLSLKIVDDEDWIYNTYEALVSDFTEVAWKDYMLFIRVEDIYYTFDIKSYGLPNQDDLPKNKKGEILYDEIVPEYDLREYNKHEFIKKYPDYKDYEWYSY